jgi:uncharacterized repeat protein (TIGR01451 family)
VKVDFRCLGASLGRVRILAAGLALFAAGCGALGWSSRSHGNVAGNVSAISLGARTPYNSTASRGTGSAASAAKSQARSLFAGLPLMFEPNEGQGNLDPADPRAKFIARGSGYSLFLGSEGAILNVSRREPVKQKGVASVSRVDSLGMRLAGANPNAKVTAADLLPGKSNYFLGNDPAKWRRGIPQFARVRYENVYPGINLVFYGNQGHLEYDFQVAPGADPKQAELEFDGAKRIELIDGALVIKVQGGKTQGGRGQGGRITLQAPQVYQEIAGHRQPVEGRFVLRGAGRVGFAIGNYDRSRELVIDPILTFSTYFGGVNNELNNSVAVDEAFNVYLAGSTNSPNLVPPTMSVVQNMLKGPQNVYIAKITPPQGSNIAVLDYVTYLGGNGIDTPVGIGVDGAFDPYVAGTTTSSNFPPSTTNPYQSSPKSPGTHVFVTRLNSSASDLIYSSYLSGSGTDMASGMTIDGQGFLYVTGTTTSTNPQDYAPGVQWPVISEPNGQPFQLTPKAPAGIAQFFVTKVNTLSAGSASIAYSTYFGGGSWNNTSGSTQPVANGGGIAVDTIGNIYFTGTTNFLFVGMTGTQLTDFPILNAYQPCLDQPAPPVIVNPPSCSGTSSDTLPDAFLAKLSPNPLVAGSAQLGWSTYLGGTGSDSGTGIAVDTGAANVYVTGTTDSTDIAENQLTSTTTAAFQRCLDQPVNPPTGTACTPPSSPPYDAFVAKFPNLTATTPNTSNLQLVYFSYLGGSDNEAGLGIAVDLAAGAVLTGWTQSPDFPIFPALANGGDGIQNALTGSEDAFVARLNTAASIQNTSGSWATYFGGSTTNTGAASLTEGTSVTLDINQNVYFAGDTNSIDLQVLKPLQGYPGTAPNASSAFVAELGAASTLSVTGLLTLANNQQYISAGNPATFTYTITNSGPDPAYNISVVDTLDESSTLVPVTFSSATATSGECGGGSNSSGVSCSIPSLQSGSTATVTIVLIPNSPGTSHSFTGGTLQVSSPSNITPATTTVPGNVSDYTMKVTPNNQSVTAGNTASYQVVLAPSPIYSSAISLGCSGVPAAATCNFTSPSVTPGGSPSSSTLNVTTTVRPITVSSNAKRRWFYALWLALPGLAILGFGSQDRRKRRMAGILFLCTISSLLVLLPACSHSVVQPPVSGTPAGTYTLNVTATSGTDSKTYPVQLTVN